MPGDADTLPLNKVLCGHALDVLKRLPSSTVDTCITSPPYWGLRSYNTEPQIWGGAEGCAHDWRGEVRTVETTRKGGKWQQANNGQGMAQGKLWTRFRGDMAAATANRTFETAAFGKCVKCGAWRGELGLEPVPALYVEHLLTVFREVWRVLKDGGTLWLNMGDCYATAAGRVGEHPGGGRQGARWRGEHSKHHVRKLDSNTIADGERGIGPVTQPNRMPLPGLKAKDLVGIPWMVAFALRADGWRLRSDIIWHKPNPMPESVRDRPTRAHEYVFLFSKHRRYYYDAAAIAEPVGRRGD
ncbi:MAG: site-specific DNA-methyltransferase, partial [Acidobacteria bacterium]|nr:site-specific DNA-methyltransferase [Acidobacteriota bacterium]